MLNTKRGLGYLLVSTLFVFTACEKSSDDSGVNIPESTMSFTLNGTAKTFNNAVAVQMVQDTVNLLTITGLTGTDSSKTLTVLVGSKGDITSGFTVNQTSFGGSEQSMGIVNYFENSKGYSSFGMPDESAAQVEIHITEKTASNVKGTFTAKLFSEDEDDQASPYLVTEGKFNAKLTVH
jgi:hypothetical protein